MWLYSCFQWFKDTNLKANHNTLADSMVGLYAVSNGSKILIWKQITTWSISFYWCSCCFQWFKDTNLKANHNLAISSRFRRNAVSNGSKILIWKQITTSPTSLILLVRCFQWFKDTNLKANHNLFYMPYFQFQAVSNGSKILIWKQITTNSQVIDYNWRCFQWFKDTNLKANHNMKACDNHKVPAVSNGSKILIWKQITTCFICPIFNFKLFPMVQRY